MDIRKIWIATNDAGTRTRLISFRKGNGHVRNCDCLEHVDGGDGVDRACLTQKLVACSDLERLLGVRTVFRIHR